MTVGYVLCSIAILYDDAETSYFFSSTGPVCRCHWLFMHSRYFETNLASVPWTRLPICGTFWDAGDARAWRVLAPAALGFPIS